MKQKIIFGAAQKRKPGLISYAMYNVAYYTNL